MKTYDIKIDLLKINKEKILEREYVRQDGVTIKVKDYKLRVVIQDQNKHKELFKGNGFTVNKIGFVAEPTTKEERDSGVESVFLGEVTELVSDNSPSQAPQGSLNNY